MQIAQRLYQGIEIDGETIGLITYMRTDGFLLTIFEEISLMLNFLSLILAIASFISFLFLKENFSIFFPSN